MPKMLRAPEEVDAVKQKILETALDLMCEDGFDSLSMRKLASRVGMTAANIYNYYENKDELYLVIQTNGFRMLVERFTEIAGFSCGHGDKIRQMMRAYVDFGTDNPDYYEIMFSRNTPKFTDYRGTPMEAAATIEKQTALKVADIACRTLLEFRNAGSMISDDDAHYLTILAWSTLHGIVNLYNSRVLQETTDDADRFIERFLDDLIRHFVAHA
ncbi:MAG: TetR/AcrR family transcriptional regulator [Desulfobacteraceae bacterium]|jgi:AcrR family transcriptional regulator